MPGPGLPLPERAAGTALGLERCLLVGGGAKCESRLGQADGRGGGDAVLALQLGDQLMAFLWVKQLPAVSLFIKETEWGFPVFWCH